MRPRYLIGLGVCVLITAAAGPCTPPPAPGSTGCEAALTAAANEESFLDAAGDDGTQTYADRRAQIDRARATCAPTTTTTEATTTTTETPTTETTVPETTTTTQPVEPGAFPTEATTGVPAGWEATENVTGNLIVSTPGAVVEDIAMVGGNIWVRAPDVTIRRVLMLGGRINNACCINQDPYDGNVADRSQPGMLVEDVTFTNPMGVAHTDDIYYRLGDSNYTARRVKILDQLEGADTRFGDKAGAGEVVIEDSYIRIDTSTVANPGCGGHPDGIQGYVGAHATIRHNTIHLPPPGECENSTVFIADNTAGADVVGNLLIGGGFTLQLNDGPFRFVGNRIADGEWAYGPLHCGGGIGFSMVEQSDNRLVTLDGYTVTGVGALVGC